MGVVREESPVAMRSQLHAVRLALAGVLAAGAIVMVIFTYRWPLVWDAQVLHYIRFLIDSGFAPYREISDINMPGAYVIEGWAMHLFGGGDLAWRVFDFTLLGVLTGAMIVIALPYDWLAGLFAGVMFALIHTSNGPWNSVERDEVMTVLVVLGYAFLFEGVRRRRPWLLLAFGLSVGMAGTVKPTAAPLGVLLLAIAAWEVRKRGEPVARYVAWGMAGGAIAGGIVLSFLLRYHAVHAFLDITSRLTSFYAGLDHATMRQMARWALPNAEWLMLPFALAVAFANRDWKNWERGALLAGAGFGALSYFIQGKGYEYHKYPFTAFALLWMAIELTLAMRRTGWVRIAGVAGLAAATLTGVPLYLRFVHRLQPVSNFTLALERDLAAMGTDRLQHEVQCMDLVEGCYTALYHLKLVQSTGMMGDLLLFSANESTVVDQYRSGYWKQLTAKPPAVIVLTNEWFGHLPSFDKLGAWPSFASYLEANYQMTIARDFPEEADHAYRVYLRKDLVKDVVRSGMVRNGVPLAAGR
ncbi:MAG: hypothetical protein QOH85_503 [Acidobacteriaceae bacterium]|nr:hypothetical protein [Acidobacteriaceae bacterium]